MQSNKLMIVAHPDDESLFGGAQLLMSPGWTVVSVTNGDNAVRRAEFEAAMALVGATPIAWSYTDFHCLLLDEEPLLADLRRLIHGQPWSQIVTHNVEGEYGHMHHLQLHRLVNRITPASCFGFGGEHLSNDLWSRKLELIECYQSQRGAYGEHLPYARRETLVGP